MIFKSLALEACFLCHGFHQRVQLVNSHSTRFKPGFLWQRVFSVIYAEVKWRVCSIHCARPLRSINFIYCNGSRSHGPFVAKAFGLIGLTLRGSAPILVLVWRSVYSKYSVPSASCSSFTSPQAMSRCSWHPLNPKWTVLKNHSVFDNASALEIPRRFCSKRLFTSSSVKACAASGLLPFPCFFSCLLRASRHFLVCSNSAPSMMLPGWFCSLKCLLKLAISPRRLDGSYSSPSFLFTLKINSLRYSLSSCGVSSSGFLDSPMTVRNAYSSFTSRSVFALVFLFSWSAINSFTELSKGGNLWAMATRNFEAATESIARFAFTGVF